MQSTGNRTTPDVAFVADPATGAWAADPYNLTGSDPFEVVGGTSLSAPCWAGLVALANQGREAAGQSNFNTASPTDVQQALYALPQSDYNVIASGFNGYNAGPGYNLVTGLGTPLANLLVPDLIAWSGSKTPYKGSPVGPIQSANLVNHGVTTNGPSNVPNAFDALLFSTAGNIEFARLMELMPLAPGANLEASGGGHAGQAPFDLAAIGVHAASLALGGPFPGTLPLMFQEANVAPPAGSEAALSTAPFQMTAGFSGTAANGANVGNSNQTLYLLQAETLKSRLAAAGLDQFPASLQLLDEVLDDLRLPASIENSHWLAAERVARPAALDAMFADFEDADGGLLECPNSRPTWGESVPGSNWAMVGSLGALARRGRSFPTGKRAPVERRLTLTGPPRRRS